MSKIIINNNSTMSDKLLDFYKICTLDDLKSLLSNRTDDHLCVALFNTLNKIKQLEAENKRLRECFEWKPLPEKCPQKFFNGALRLLRNPDGCVSIFFFDKIANDFDVDGDLFNYPQVFVYFEKYREIEPEEFE